MSLKTSLFTDGEKDEKDRKRRGSKTRTGRKATVISAPILDKKAEQLSSLNIVIDAEQNTNILSSPSKIEKGKYQKVSIHLNVRNFIRGWGYA